MPDNDLAITLEGYAIAVIVNRFRRYRKRQIRNTVTTAKCVIEIPRGGVAKQCAHAAKATRFHQNFAV